VRRNTWSG